MRLLAGTEIQQAVSSLVSQDGDVDIAVAYWGQDSLERTGIANKENGKLRVICDLLSGSCNPAPIAALKQNRIPVLTLDRLHSKVWINGNDVILGSANASMGGLPITDDDLQRCRDEANVEMQDEALAQSLRTWFDQRWDLAREIDDRDLRRAR
ncbi:MAG: phospholipase D-like domain-containing protein, partial [Bryobacterales bacterium]|nr:phospholipase D-like domain-containing protein [Bryobacterales bacterium]